MEIYVNAEHSRKCEFVKSLYEPKLIKDKKYGTNMFNYIEAAYELCAKNKDLEGKSFEQIQEEAVKYLDQMKEHRTERWDVYLNYPVEIVDILQVLVNQNLGNDKDGVDATLIKSYQDKG